MSDEAPAPKDKVRAILPDGKKITIGEKTFRLEMATVISGKREDMEAVKIKPE